MSEVHYSWWQRKKKLSPAQIRLLQIRMKRSYKKWDTISKIAKSVQEKESKEADDELNSALNSL